MKKKDLHRFKTYLITLACFTFIATQLFFGTITLAVGTSYQFSSGFSSYQGANQWYYKQYNGSSYSDMSWDSSNGRWQGAQTYCLIGNGWLHPDTNEAVLAWKAPVSGTVTVSGFMEINLADGDGVETRIRHLSNGTTEQIWPSSGNQIIYPKFSAQHVLVVEVIANDYLYFHLNKGSTNSYDTLTWDPLIVYDAPPVFTLDKAECVMNPSTFDSMSITCLDTSFSYIGNSNGDPYWLHSENWGDIHQKLQGPLNSPGETLIWEKTGSQFYSNPNSLSEDWKWSISNLYEDEYGGQLAFCHLEDITHKDDAVDPYVDYRIGLAYSTNNGDTFSKLGYIIAQNVESNHDDINITGCPYVVVDGYFYVYYWDYNPDSYRAQVYTAVARASVQDVISAARNNTVTSWNKFYGGTWNESGMGGIADDLMESEIQSTSPTYIIPHSDAAYCETMGTYVLTGYTVQDGKGLWMTTSKDGINWDLCQPIQKCSTSSISLSPYPTIVNIDGTDNSEIGASFYVYYGFAPYFDTLQNGNIKYLYRQKVTLCGEPNTVKVWHFQSSTEGWQAANDLTNISASQSWISSSLTGNDPYLYSPDNLDVDLSDFDKIVIRYANNTDGEFADIWFTTSADQSWTSGKKISFSTIMKDPVSSHEYILDMSSISGWSGTLKQLRFDPSSGVSNGQIAIDYIKIIRTAPFYQAMTDFSGTQGEKQWSYQEWNGSSYQNMSWDATNKRWYGSQQYCLTGNNWQAPETNDSVRKWVAPSCGIITITATNAITVSSGSGADGVKLKVLKNNVNIWPSSGWYNLSAGSSVNFPTSSISVKTGDIIYFVVNKNINNYFDTVSWEPKIEY